MFIKLTTVLVTVLKYLCISDEFNVSNNVCYSTACKITAQRIIGDSEPSVKPCDNFYQFACGNFIAMRSGAGVITRLGLKNNEIEGQIRSIIKHHPKPFEALPLRITKLFYHMCLDEEKMDARGAAPGVAILEKLGGWPVLGNWDPAKWNILEPEIRAWHLGLEGHHLMEISFFFDLTDRTKYVFMVEQPELPIPREYLIEGEDNSMVKEYFQYMVDLAILFGADSRTAEVAMKKVLKLQIEIAKVLVPVENLRGHNQQFIKFTIKQLDEYPVKLYDWRKLFEGIVSPRQLSDNLRIDLYDLEVFQKVLPLINGSPAETVANYIMWNYAMKISPYLTTAMRDRNQRFEQLMDGSNGRLSRWSECMTELQGLNLAVSAIYVNKFFDKSSRDKAKAMINRVQNEMDNVLREADWMDEKTRKMALRKSANMQHVVGYADELADMKTVEEHYKELNLNKKHFFEAQLELNAFLKKEQVRKMYEVHVTRPWTLYPMITKANAYYTKAGNSIVVNAGILQEPFFSASVPSYLNYGRIGFIIGHEITHAFDDEGREFDSEGELNEWWDEASLNNFNNKKQCFIDQYGSFIESVTKRNVNGILTQGENIADNGGLKLAYRAYRRMADQLKKPEPGLPGLEHYNNDQLFFISFANARCSVLTPELLENKLLTDSHAPSEWRVNGMVMNMPQFGEIFGCEKGTPMNPVEKCEVW